MRAERQSYAGNVWKFYAFRGLVHFQLWLPIWVVYLTDERGFSLTQVTALDAPFWVLMVLLEVPTGAVADRWGRKTSLSLGALLYTATIVGFGLATTYWLVLASYLLWAVAWTLFSGADAAFLYDSLKAMGREAEYQKLYGRAWAVDSIASVVGLLIGAPLAALTTLSFPIVLSGAFIFLAWLVTLSMREPPRHEGERLGYLSNARAAARIAWRTREVRYLLLLSGSSVAVAVSTFILVQPFLLHHGMAVENLGWFGVPGHVIGIIAALNAYRLAAALGVTRVILLLPLLPAVALAALGSLDHLAAFAFYPLLSFLWGLSQPVVSTYVNERIPSAQRATILSFGQLVLSLLVAPLEPAMGAIADAHGLLAAYRLGLGALLVLVLPLTVLWLRAHRAAPTAAPQVAIAG
ncbi:MAG: MFS transporter [Chloroflexota bacterium]|nr:MFS transporter [Chloroflexota bacterium]